jgi:tetratricopeptide (TPR) repeat protein
MAKVNTGTDVKGQYKPLSEADIQARTDDASFRKGYDYYLHHALVEPILSESVLRAFCHGSSGDPYRVEATLLPAGEKSTHQWATADCSCPREGFCKHLVALLLVWVHQPERFVVRSRLMGRLSAKSREELLALLEQLVQRQPDIEPMVELLIELPLALPAQEKNRPGRGKERTVHPSSIESQVASAFYHAGEGWGAASRVAAELDPLCDIGKSFAEAGEWANAQVVYATIAEETVIHYEGLHDEGQVSWILGVCAAGLVACLNAQSTLPKREQVDAEEREELLTTLFDLWKFGDNYGGIGVDVAGAIAGNATARERKRVEAWLREEMRPGQDSSSTWHNRSVVDFVVKLKQAEHSSEEDVLKEYRHAGLYKELAERFLQLGRTNEALDVAQANLTESRDVTWFAEQLLKLGEGWREQALAFVEMRLGEIEPALQGTARDFTGLHTLDTYRRWLSEKYVLYSKAKQALDMECARFQAHPDDGTYRSVRSVAQVPEQSERVWSDLRPRLIQVLEQQGHWGALVSISLDEGEVDQALAALAKMEQQPNTSLSGYGYQSAPGHYHIQVAKAAEERYPDEAIRLYERVVERLIAGRGRENYQQAAGYLTRVKQLYQKQGHQPQWHAYVTNLRNSNKSLRALKEELDTRGL